MERHIRLSNGNRMPKLGLGTWQLQGSSCRTAVEHALMVGYRHIDTAEAYENESEVGQALTSSGVSRTDIFLTSKIRREYLQHDAVLRSCEGTLQRLGVDYLDLYLIHWPNRHIPLRETMDALAILKERALIRAIGVSNFPIERVKEALAIGIPFVVNQVEFHPSLNQHDLKAYCDANQIHITAYSPIAQGHDLVLPTVQQIAQSIGRTPSQVVLNWLMSKDMSAIPRSATPQHIEENFQSLQFDLAPEHIQALDTLHENFRVVNPRFAEFST